MPDNLDISNSVEKVEECTKKISADRVKFVVAVVNHSACVGIVGDDNCNEFYAKVVCVTQKFQSALGALAKNMTVISETLDGADQSVAKSESGK